MKISEKQLNKIKQIAEKYQLKLVLLFGSRVDEKMVYPDSDYDIAYLPEKSFDFEKECYLNFEFTNVMPSDKVDTVDLRKASPLLLKMIFDNAQTLYKEDEMIFPTYQSYAFKKFIESKPLYELKHQRLREKLKK
ncbi:MAG: nucleotidyltransferase domain-containing protein [Patescibacteria group bacterium]